MSVFVNPAQFGAGEDLERYPADQQGDITAAEVAGADAVWFPSVQDVYGSSRPPGRLSRNPGTAAKPLRSLAARPLRGGCWP